MLINGGIYKTSLIDSSKPKLINKGFWYDTLYPNSIVVKNDTIFIGAIGGLIMYDNKNLKWLSE